MTTILLAGVLGFLVALAIVLTVIRMDMTARYFHFGRFGRSTCLRSAEKWG